MSLDFYLYAGGRNIVNHNITHNLNRMAEAAGIYGALWRPDENGFVRAGEIIPLLREGLIKMWGDPEHYKTFDAPNGWGTYDNFVPWVGRVLADCETYPDAVIQVSR